MNSPYKFDDSLDVLGAGSGLLLVWIVAIVLFVLAIFLPWFVYRIKVYVKRTNENVQKQNIILQELAQYLREPRISRNGGMRESQIPKEKKW